MKNDGGWADQPTSYGLQPPGMPDSAHFTPGAAPAPVPPQPSVPAPPAPPAGGAHSPTQLHDAPGAADPGAGRRIGGRYRLVSRLGHGGMGTVWKARDEVVDRDVAVKEPRVPAHLPEAVREQVHQRMRREARAAARIDHPSVVAVHDVVVEDGRPWIVMELVRGRSLGDRLADGTLDPREAARIGLAVLDALCAAHEAGVLHRDVKPDNVLLGRGDRVVLTDFGIARIEGEQGLTETGAFVGSPEFVAPERVLGQQPGPESDLWSLGVVLYAAAEGVSPFRRSNTQATMQAVLSTEPQVPVRAAGELGALVMALLRKDPAARPAAAQVRQALESVARPPAPRPAAFTTAHAGQGTGSAWVPPVLQGNRKAQFALGGGVLAAAVAATLIVVDPFAKETLPANWRVRPEGEVVKASVAVPGDYARTVETDNRSVSFHDPSGIFAVHVSQDTDEERRKTYGDKPKDVGSAEVEAKRVMDRYKGGKEPSVNEAQATMARTTYQGGEAAEVTTVYRRSGDSEKDPKRCRRTHLFVNKAESTVWEVEVSMPAAGEGRKDGDKLFDSVLKYLKIEDSAK
ncbi:serine/threonine-protein kinase [Streptomyces sp. NPDC026206]|uniref:serine/threonine-protein kinase n=1 Tax=Streptomyces sp. NPDC026206 TaxID=3157089 RepID=UPI0033E07C20